MLTKLDHVTIAVLDVDAAVAHYRALLGAPPIWRGTHPELATSAALFGLDNAMLELMGPSAEAPEAPEAEGLRSLLHTHGEGLQTLSFASDDVARVSRELRARGVRATAPQLGEARASDGQLRQYRLVELSPRDTRALPISIVERTTSVSADARPSPSPAAVHALDHVLIASADLEHAVQLYGTKLGLRLALDRVVDGRRMLFFRCGGVTLEIVDEPARKDGDVLAGLAYRVDQLAPAHTRLRESGFEVSELRLGQKPGTEVFTVRSGSHGVPTLFLHDPSRSRAV